MRTYASATVSPVTARGWAAPIALIVLWFAAHAALAQSLGWEGPTGVFVTPLAYTAASPAKGIGNPAVAYHFLAGGPVIGDHSTVSVTEGFAKRFEFGFTEVVHAAGAYGDEGKYTDSTGAFDPPSNLFGDFSILHVKANLLPENFHKNNWVPAVSAGAIYRFNDQFGANLNNFLTYDSDDGQTTADQRTNNEDIYVVATKIVTQTKPIPILLSAGLRGTNSSLWGFAGNSPGFEGKVFGAAALIFTGPKKSTIIIGSEVSEQPRHIYSNLLALEGAPKWVQNGLFDVPTSEVYAARIVPFAKRKFNVDVGVLHAGNDISGPLVQDALDVNHLYINARARVGFGLSYAF